MKHKERTRRLCNLWGLLPVAALIAWLGESLPALAQDNVLATATLTRDLSPWDM
jgi:hypothetical protein